MGTITHKRQGCGAQDQWIRLQNTPVPKAYGIFQKRGQESVFLQVCGAVEMIFITEECLSDIHTQ